MENVRKYRDITLVTTDKRIIQLVSEPDFHTIKYFKKTLSQQEKEIRIKFNKPVYRALLILGISKTLYMNFAIIILKESIKTMQN